jgi:hypothetical protein
MDMKYYWLQDRVRQKQFYVYWRPGKDKLGDYHTKHHSENITNICALSYYTRLTDSMICDDVLNSRSPSCASQQTHRHPSAPCDPLTSDVR